MNIHEYQAKEVLRRFGVAVPEGKVARSADEAAAAFDALKSRSPWSRPRSTPAAAARRAA
jgi:succinyl-CoA synthetase beta subunit